MRGALGNKWSHLSLCGLLCLFSLTMSAPGAASGSGRLNDFWLKSVFFSDPQHGWALGSFFTPRGHVLTLHRTVDGGRHWSRIRPPQDARLAGPPYAHLWRPPHPHPLGVHDVRFATPRTGWVFGPSLFATTNAGSTWRVLHPGGYVWQLRPSHHGVVAVLRVCRGSGHGCHLSIRSSTNGGRAWVTLVRFPAFEGGQAALERSGRALWALSYTRSDEWSHSQGLLIRSTDGGQTWSRQQSPCHAYAERQVLSAASPRTLWLECETEPGAGSALKRRFISTDAGASWRLVDEYGGGAVTVVAALSPTVAWEVCWYCGLMRTTTAGRRWKSVLSMEDGTGWVDLRFLDSTFGWAAYRGTILVTSDGGSTWIRRDLAFVT